MKSRRYSDILNQFDAFAIITKQSSPILNEHKPGAYVDHAKMLLIHESARNNKLVWHHELGHMIANHTGTELNSAEEEAFAYSYQYMSEFAPLHSFTERLVTICLTRGLNEFRRKNKNEIYQSMSTEKINVGKIRGLLKQVKLHKLIASDTLPEIDGVSVCDDSHNERAQRINLKQEASE